MTHFKVLGRLAVLSGTGRTPAVVDPSRGCNTAATNPSRGQATFSTPFLLNYLAISSQAIHSLDFLFGYLVNGSKIRQISFKLAT